MGRNKMTTTSSGRQNRILVRADVRTMNAGFEQESERASTSAANLSRTPTRRSPNEATPDACNCLCQPRNLVNMDHECRCDGARSKKIRRHLRLPVRWRISVKPGADDGRHLGSRNRCCSSRTMLGNEQRDHREKGRIALVTRRLRFRQCIRFGRRKTLPERGCGGRGT